MLFRSSESEQNNRVPVGSIQKFSIENGPGIRTTVFLKAGLARGQHSKSLQSCGAASDSDAAQKLASAPSRRIRYRPQLQVGAKDTPVETGPSRCQTPNQAAPSPGCHSGRSFIPYKYLNIKIKITFN